MPPLAEKRQAQEAYTAIVSAARNPYLYAQCGVPDTLDGRFDAIVLHLFLAQRRLSAMADAKASRFARALNEAFIADMDRNLRQIGVGDMGVGRRVQKMASALLGRLQAYEAAFGDEAALAEALSRNIYRDAPPPAECQERLLRYIAATDAELTVKPAEAIFQGIL